MFRRLLGGGEGDSGSFVSTLDRDGGEVLRTNVGVTELLNNDLGVPVSEGTSVELRTGETSLLKTGRLEHSDDLVCGCQRMIL